MDASDRGSGARHRVLIVDDHPVVRKGVRALVSAQEDLEFCGEATTLSEAIRFLEESKAEVVVLDLSLKDCHGLTGLGELLRRSPRTRILIFSGYDEQLYAERVLRAGAKGYLQKAEHSDQLLEAIRRIIRGEIYVSSRVANQLFGRFGQRQPVPGVLACLSDRELAVFQSLGYGLSTKQIARQLVVSIKTVESCRDSIKRKLHLRTSAELTWFAIRSLLEGSELALADEPTAPAADLMR